MGNERASACCPRGKATLRLIQFIDSVFNQSLKQITIKSGQPRLSSSLDILFEIEATLENRRHLEPTEAVTGKREELFAVKGDGASDGPQKALH